MKNSGIIGINHFNLAVNDMNRSFLFYTQVLGFKPLCKSDGSAYLLAGNFWVSLDLDRQGFRKPSPCNTHIAFTVGPEDFEVMVCKIAQSGTLIYKENTSPGSSLYFQDPDGHKLEIHTGTWQERLAAKKVNPGAWTNVEWFV